MTREKLQKEWEDRTAEALLDEVRRGEDFANTLRKALEHLFAPETMPRIPDTDAGQELFLRTVLAEARRCAPAELAPKLRARFVPEPEDPVEREHLRAERRRIGASEPIELYWEEEVFDLGVFVEKEKR